MPRPWSVLDSTGSGKPSKVSDQKAAWLGLCLGNHVFSCVQDAAKRERHPSGQSSWDHGAGDQ